MTEYIWHGSGPLRRGRESDDWVYPGEAFEPTEAEQRSFGDLIEEADADDPAPGPEPVPVDPPFDPADYTVDELRDRMDDTDYSDDEIAALEAAEQAGENRTTALEAITGIR